MSLRSFVFPRLAPVAALALGLGMVHPAAAAPTPKKARPKVEVVFCLDTTGSMGGLIDGAKRKIWSMSNQIASGKPTPDIKIGLVAYRDKNDAYVTQVFDLTDDLDAVHAKLQGFQAAGGGDEPESVNQALADAVNKIKWSTDKKTLRIVFLVGDAPPHMDYTDDVKYPETCKKACEKGIIINTIQCGGNANCTKVWKDICVKAEGSFAQIEQDGGVVAVPTPYDKDLAKINSELADSTVVYGRGEKHAEARRKVEAAKALPAPAAADRAGFLSKGGRAATYDLVDAVKAGKVDLEKIKKEDLPKELRDKSPKERKEYLDKLDKRRAELRKQALELDKKRSEFIARKLAADKGKGKDSFDSHVLETLRKQAKKSGIDY